MNAVLSPTMNCGNRLVPRNTAPSIGQQVRSLMMSLYNAPNPDRRVAQRVYLPYLMQLTPLGANEDLLVDQTIIVVGKDISATGLGFYHQQQLPYRRVLITLDHPQIGRFSVEIDVQRCRFTKLGWYESGGRLLRVIQGPSAQAKYAS